MLEPAMALQPESKNRISIRLLILEAIRVDALQRAREVVPIGGVRRIGGFRSGTNNQRSFYFRPAFTLVLRGIPAAACLEKEPDAPFCFVNPDLYEAGRGNISPFLADVVSFS